MNNKFRYLVRYIDAVDYLEGFLISAVAAILAIRTFLALTNYPQISGEGFHISHMLWGGLMMMIAIIVLITFLNKEAKNFAAIIGGVGFGTFIDELGKLITSDSNYFFKPTIALIYVIFILIYLIYKLVGKHPKPTKKEYAVNALEMIKEAVLHNLDVEEKSKAQKYLKSSNSRDPIVRVLKETIAQIDTIPLKKNGLTTKFRNETRNYYLKLIKSPRFSRIVVMFFILVSTLRILFYGLGLTTENSFSQWGLFLSSSATGLFLFSGIFFLKRKWRIPAYEMFKIAVLISIFLTQFFLFFRDQLSAIVLLGISILIWNVIQNLIHQEILLFNDK